MHADRPLWDRSLSLLDQALALEGDARTRFVAEIEKTYPDVSPLLKRLLSAHQRIETKDIFETLPLSARAAALESSGHVGQRIGPYELIESLGAGGMGSVWRARQVDGALQREVALKFPGLQAHSGSIANIKARFARERDFLAALEHPNIARLYDAGVADDGQPYFAMEFVRGLPIDAYCSEHQLTVAQRLALFAQVLRAVAFAHQRLILHRDLKPGNVLVDAEGQVRLLDFGVAKLLPNAVAGEQGAGAIPSASDLTEIAGAAITLSYAAPEQITKGELTTATDVYALGVLLYRLLAGCSPYAPKRDSRGAMEEAVLSDDVALASSRLFDSAHLTAAQASAPQLKKQLAGDIDTILAKALKKLPSARYESATALADDLHRHSALQPIRARPDSLNYRATRFLARNRLAVIASTVAVSVLVATTGVAVWQAGAAEKNATLAKKEAARATAAQKFFSGLFAFADPEKNKNVTAADQEILERALVTADAQFASDPETHAYILSQLADVYFRLGLPEKLIGVQRRRVAVLDAMASPPIDAWLNAQGDLAQAERTSASPEERAQEMPRLFRAVERMRASHASDTTVVRTLGMLADGLASEGKSKEALSVAQEALAHAQRTLPSPHPMLSFAYEAVAVTAQRVGDFAQARGAMRESVLIDESGQGRSTVDRIAGYVSYAEIELLLGNFVESGRVATAAIKLARADLGDVGDNLSRARRIAVIAALRAGDKKGIQALEQRELSLEVNAVDPIRRGRGLYTQGMIDLSAGKYNVAEEILSEAERLLSSSPSLVRLIRTLRAEAHLKQNSNQAALAILEPLHATIKEKRGTEVIDFVRAAHAYGVALARSGEISTAQSVFDTGCKWILATREENHPDRVRCEANLVLISSDLTLEAKRARLDTLRSRFVASRADFPPLINSLNSALEWLSVPQGVPFGFQQFPFLD